MRTISFPADELVVDRIIKHLPMIFAAEPPQVPEIQRNIALKITPADISE